MREAYELNLKRTGFLRIPSMLSFYAYVLRSPSTLTFYAFPLRFNLKACSEISLRSHAHD